MVPVTHGGPPLVAWVSRSYLEPPPLALRDQKGTLGLGMPPSRWDGSGQAQELPGSQVGVPSIPHAT